MPAHALDRYRRPPPASGILLEFLQCDVHFPHRAQGARDALDVAGEPAVGLACGGGRHRQGLAQSARRHARLMHRADITAPRARQVIQYQL